MPTPAKTDPAIFAALPREATLANRVVRQLETMIAQGGLADGSRLPPERDLANQFGVSRTVIREAVAALSARGLLDVQAGSGTVVKRPSAEAVANLLGLSLAIAKADPAADASQPSPEQLREVVRCLAVEAAELAAGLRTDDDVERMARISRTYPETAAGAVTPKASDIELIRALAAAAHNPLIELLLDAVAQMCDPRDRARIAAQCRAAVDPIRKADSKASRRALRDSFEEPEPAKSGTKKDKKASAG